MHQLAFCAMFAYVHQGSHKITFLQQCLTHLQKLRPQNVNCVNCFMQDNCLRMISLSKSLNVLLTLNKDIYNNTIQLREESSTKRYTSGPSCSKVG